MHDPQLPSGEPSAPIRPVRRAALVFIFITVALDTLALGVIIPVFAPLVLGMVGGVEQRATWYIFVFNTSWAAMQFVAGPLLGALSDRFGRRPVVLLSNFGLGLDYIVMALAPTPAWLFLGRVVSGFTAGSIPTAYAYIADVTPPDKRAASFGVVGGAFAAGFILGPALGGALGHIDLRLPFWVSAALSLANACYGLFVLPESLPVERRAPFSWRRANPVAALGFLRSHRELFGLAAVLVLFYLAHEVFTSVYVLYFDTRVHLDEQTVGYLLGTAGVSSALTQGLLVRRSLAWAGERGTILLGSVCGAAGFALYGFATQLWVIWLAVPLCSLWGLASPPTQAVMSRRVSPTEQGRLQGATGSLRGIVGMAGPWLFTTTFAAFAVDGWAGRQGVRLPGAPFLLSATLVLAGLAVAWAVTRPREGQGTTPPGPMAMPGAPENAPSGYTSEVT